MLNRAIVYANIVLGIIIIITLGWSMPYLLSSFSLYQAGQALNAALIEEGIATTRWDVMNPNSFALTAEEIQSLPPKHLQAAQRYLLHAIKRDESLESARRALGEVLFAQESRYTDRDLSSWRRSFSAQLRAGIFFCEQEDYETAQMTLEEARRYITYDLLTNLYLHEVYTHLNKPEEAAKTRGYLERYNLPQDERFYLQLARALPLLVEQDFWDEDTTARLINLFVNYGDAASADVALDYLIANGDEARWHYWRGRTRWLQGNYADAVQEFNHAINSDPQYAAAYAALGQTLFEAIQDPTGAVDAYTQYLALAPQDVIAMTRLKDAYQALGKDSEVAALDQVLLEYTDQHIAAQILGIEAISLGDNLIANGNFEYAGDSWHSWKWSVMADGERWNEGWFERGLDSFNRAAGEQSAQVHSFWKQENEELAPARAGFWYDAIDLKTNTLYLVSFYYRTGGLRNGHARVWLSADKTAPFTGDYSLPDTDGQWRKCIIVGWSSSNATRDNTNQISPLLRSWGVGDVWFDDVQVREIGIADGAVDLNMETRVVVK